VHRVMIMGIGIACLECSSGPVNCTAAKTMLAYSSLSPGLELAWTGATSTHAALVLTRSKPSNCEAPDASIGACLYAVSTEIVSVVRA
jgi:hypothetical protein